MILLLTLQENCSKKFKQNAMLDHTNLLKISARLHNIIATRVIYITLELYNYNTFIAYLSMISGIVFSANVL